MLLDGVGGSVEVDVDVVSSVYVVEAMVAVTVRLLIAVRSLGTPDIGYTVCEPGRHV